MTTSTTIATFTSLALGLSATALYWLIASRSNRAAVSIEDEAPSPIIQGNKIKVLSGQELLHPKHRRALVQQIQDRLGMSNEAFKADVMPLLEQFAYYVQQVPASENHHHAHPGGLLDHSLESAAIALRHCSAKELPINTPTEDRKKLAPVWRYGVLVAALLHDLGKPLTGMIINLYELPDTNDPIRWHPDAGVMDMGQRYAWYSVDFPEVMPEYSLHNRLAWSLFNQVVPMSSRAWMSATDNRLVEDLRLFLTGNAVAPFSEISKAADQESTANNLKSGIKTRFASAKRKPLREVLIDNLRAMLAEQGTYFSLAKDHGGDVFRYEDKILIMSKTLADELRKYINDQKNFSIPTDNEKLFGTLFECGACLPNSFDANKYIWNVAITMSSGATHQLTFVCFYASTLYQDETLWPKPYQGTIELISAPIPIKKQAQEPATEKNEVGATRVDNGFETVITATENDLGHAVTLNLKQSESPKNDLGQPDSTEVNPSKATIESAVNVSETTDIGAGEPKELELDGLLKGIIASIPDVSSQVIPSITLNQPTPDTVSAKPQNKAQDKLAKLKALQVQMPNVVPITESENLAMSAKTADDGDSSNILSQSESAKPFQPNNSFSDIRPVDVTEQPSLEAVKFESKQIEAAIQASNSVEDSLLEAVQPENKIELGQQFINWLQSGIANDEIAVNNSEAAVHFVEAGMLLVTPKIFHLFANDNTPLKVPESPAKRAQQAFESLKLHKRSRVSGQYYAKVVPIGNHPTTSIKVYWIPTGNAKVLFTTLPPINSRIELQGDNLVRAG